MSDMHNATAEARPERDAESGAGMEALVLHTSLPRPTGNPQRAGQRNSPTSLRSALRTGSQGAKIM
jgi:hypothetical protein